MAGTTHVRGNDQFRRILAVIWSILRFACPAHSTQMHIFRAAMISASGGRIRRAVNGSIRVIQTDCGKGLQNDHRFELDLRGRAANHY
jgi:hypothetical protein